jgi:hypothetical protein
MLPSGANSDIDAERPSRGGSLVLPAMPNGLTD